MCAYKMKSGRSHVFIDVKGFYTFQLGDDVTSNKEALQTYLWTFAPFQYMVSKLWIKCLLLEVGVLNRSIKIEMCACTYSTTI